MSKSLIREYIEIIEDLAEMRNGYKKFILKKNHSISYVGAFLQYIFCS